MNRDIALEIAGVKEHAKAFVGRRKPRSKKK